MIFLSVGTQLPFDRFVRLVDTWAGQHPETEIFAQIGHGNYQPQNMQYCDFMDEKAYKEAFDKSSIVLAHAAMGSIISSLIASKPIIVFPRKASLGEHRNEHQLATCKNFAQLEGCHVAYDEKALYDALSNVTCLRAGALGPYANPDLLSSIESFILAEA